MVTKGDPTPLFLDTEFSGLPAVNFDPTLISVGIVSIEGKEHYVELEGIEADACTSFVREAVLPLLGPASDRLSIEEAASRTKRYIETFPGLAIVICDTPHFDFGYLKTLLQDQWPKNLLDKPYAFGPSLVPSIFRFAAKAAYQDVARTLRPHHALDDAKILRAAWIAATWAGWRPRLLGT